MIAPYECKNVLIQGVTLTNSPSWTINTILCDNVTIDNVTINNPYDSPNTDGIDPESCSNIHISNCHVDVGDDCIACLLYTSLPNSDIIEQMLIILP